MPWRLLHPVQSLHAAMMIRSTVLAKHQVGERGDPARKPSCGRRRLAGRQSKEKKITSKSKEAAKPVGPWAVSRVVVVVSASSVVSLQVGRQASVVVVQCRACYLVVAHGIGNTARWQVATSTPLALLYCRTVSDRSSMCAWIEFWVMPVLNSGGHLVSCWSESTFLKMEPQFLSIN
jgi:hypothetical protein